MPQLTAALQINALFLIGIVVAIALGMDIAKVLRWGFEGSCCRRECGCGARPRIA